MEEHEIVVIGAGFSGLGVAKRLLDAGRTDFVILEKGSEIGGTWRDNTYPGCACDVPSVLYSFSFARKPDWSRVFAQQPEIRAYLLDVVRRFGLSDYARLNTEVLSAAWTGSRWEIETTAGAYAARVLIAGTGPLHWPKIPDLPGLKSFSGTTFHTSRWKHDHDLTGRVAVVGTGSSAIQVIPEIQPHVGELTVFQRTAPWVLPKPDAAVSPLVKAAFRYVPGLQGLVRLGLYFMLEGLQYAQRAPGRMKRLEDLATWHLERQVPDPELREQLRPAFSLGCKRLLLSNAYYPAIQAPNVRFVDRGIARVTPRGVVDEDGVEHEVDTLIFGTGFHVTDPPIASCLFDRAGRSLASVWSAGPSAYLGTSVPGFPNLFLTLGPNLGNGHTSAIVLIEAQASYILSALDWLDEPGVDAIDAKAPVSEAWNRDIQEALKPMVWSAGGCASWYLTEDGVNRGIYPWSTLHLRKELREVRAEAYDVHRAEETGRRRAAG